MTKKDNRNDTNSNSTTNGGGINGSGERAAGRKGSGKRDTDRKGTPRRDVYQTITDRIVQQLEAGVRPWLKPWSGEHLGGRIDRPLRASGVPYRGINVVMLWMEAAEKGYATPFWMTFRQALELGGHVRKGESGSLVVYADSFRKTEVDAATGTEEERHIPFLKSYTVFNAEQIDGLPERFRPVAVPPNPSIARIARAEAFFAATGAQVHHGGSRAYYAEGEDRIQLPPFESFCDAESYYATLAHECVHWTKHDSRVGRDFGGKRWGDAAYAAEELVAELGSAFLSADLDLTPEVRDDHAAYIGHWLDVMKGDNRAIFTAAAHAQRAADFLNAFSSPVEAASEAEAAAAAAEEAAPIAAATPVPAAPVATAAA